MAEEFKLTQEQVTFIKQKMEVDTLKNLIITIDVESEPIREFKEQDINRITKSSFRMKGFCPPDFIKWKPTC